MGKADQAETAEVLRLQQLLQRRHEELEQLHDDPSRTEQIRKVFAAANNLVNYEARRPKLREERRRKTSSVVVYAATGTAIIAMVAELAVVHAAHRSWWYLAAVIPVAVVAFIMGYEEGNASTQGHRARAASAVVLALAAVFVLVVTAHVLSAYALILLVPVLLGVAFGWLASSDAKESQ